MASSLEIVRKWQQMLLTQDYAHMWEVVDMEGYTENCLGLTGWVTGYNLALGYFVKNVIEPWSDMKMTEEEVVEGTDTVVIRSHVEATHSGVYLGLPPTGRRVSYDVIAIIRVKDGRIVGQWVQTDLWGIYQQLTGEETKKRRFTRRDVEFPSEGVFCRGWLYVPDDLEPGEHAPGIIMANAISAIKEITLPGYAERFAEAGFVVLAFDYRNYGVSDGEPRNRLDPHDQQQDVRNGITWLRTQPEVDANNIGGWGVSLGGVHMLYLGAYDRRLKAVCSVATGLNTLEMAMGRTGLQGFLGFVNADRDRRAYTGESATYIPAVSMPGAGGLMAIPEANDFYTEAMKTYAPTYENRITLDSVENLVADRSADAVPLISPTALLMIHGERDLIPPALVRDVFEKAGEPKKLVVYDCTHTDLYVREPWVTQAADEAIAWFNRYLHNPKGKKAAQQDTERNKRMIAELYDRANAGDFSVYDEMLAPDFVSYTTAAGQEVRGIEGFKGVNKLYTDAFPDFRLEVEMLIAEDDLVTAYGAASGTFKGALFGHQPNGKTAKWSGVAVYRFNDEGKIDGRWQEFNGLGLYTQLGIDPFAGRGAG